MSVFFSLSWDAWVTLAVIVGVIAALIREWGRPDLVLLAALTTLLLAGILSPEAAFAGFSSSAVLSIAALYVVAAGVQRTGALAPMDRFLFSSSPRRSAQLFRLTATTAVLSGIVNNTPLVAILIPRLQQWARQHGVPVSKVMIPLSYAAVLGGLLTLIGTSTNLVVSGLLREATGQSLSMFDVTWIGLPAALAGILYLSLVGHRLLPDRSDPDLPAAPAHRYYFELTVAPDGPLVGTTVGTAFEGGTVPVGRQRGDEAPVPVASTDVLRGGDTLFFAGPVSLAQTLHDHPGLTRPSGPTPATAEPPGLYEAVLSGASGLVGQTLRSATFRDRYRATVLAIHRQDAELSGRLGQIPLQAGDLLLLEAPSAIYDRWLGTRDDFYFVAPLQSVPASPRREKAPVALGILGGMVALAASGVVPLLTAALTAAFALLATGCLRIEEARRSVDLPVLLMIGAAFGISQALQATGLAALLADGLLWGTQGLGVLAALALLYLVTFVLTELLTNAAAAALLLPTALDVAGALGADPVPFAVIVAIAASAGFATPFGYQTNLMVMSVGGYRFADYLRAGLPLNGIVMAVALWAVWLVWL